MEIIIQFKDGIADTVTSSTDSNTHVNVEFTPGGELDATDVQITGELTEPLTVEFVDTCIPEHPFYVRWVNRFGGWEYHMFAKHKRYNIEVGEADAYEPYAGGLSDADRTREVLAIDRADTVDVGEEQLTPGMFALLSSITASPRIDTYNVGLRRWEGVTLDGKHTVRWDTRSSRGAIAYTFRLITQNNQF